MYYKRTLPLSSYKLRRILNCVVILYRKTLIAICLDLVRVHGAGAGGDAERQAGDVGRVRAAPKGPSHHGLHKRQVHFKIINLKILVHSRKTIIINLSLIS